MKKIVALLLVVALMIACVGCTQEPLGGSSQESQSSQGESSGGSSGESSGGSGEKYKLGVSFASLDALYFQAQKDRVEQAADELGFDVVVTVADNDSSKQLQQCENLLTQEVDALLVVPVDNVAIVSVVDACAEQGVPYIAVGRMPAEMDNVTFAAQGDNFDRAWESARLIRQIADENGKTGTVKVIEMIGAMTDQAAVERHQGFQEAAAEYDLEIVSEVNTEWDTEKAYNRFNDTMQVVDEFDAVYMPSDMLISGVLSVLEKEGKLYPVGDPNHIILCGTDADSYAISQVLARNIDFSVAADAYEVMMTCVDATLDILDGDPPAEDHVIVPTSCVATWNVDEIVANGSTWGCVGLDEYL